MEKNEKAQAGKGKVVDFKKRMTEKEREDKAVTLHNNLVKIRQTINFSKFLFLTALRVIDKEHLWKELSCESFEMYVCQPDIDIGIQPDTVKKYIRIIDFYLEKGYEEEQLKDITINKLDIIRAAKNPDKYLEQAGALGLLDLRKLILENEKGLSAKDIDNADKILRDEKVKKDRASMITCPHCKKQFKIDEGI